MWAERVLNEPPIFKSVDSAYRYEARELTPASAAGLKHIVEQLAVQRQASADDIRRAVFISCWLQCNAKDVGVVGVCNSCRIQANANVLGCVARDCGFVFERDPDRTFQENVLHIARTLARIPEAFKRLFAEHVARREVFSMFNASMLFVNLTGRHVPRTDGTYRKEIGGLKTAGTTYLNLSVTSQITVSGRADTVQQILDGLLPCIETCLSATSCG